MRSRLLVLLCLLHVTGCFLPKTTVVKDPGPHDRGVRYYRPKPYLVVKPLVNAKTGDPIPGYVILETAMLPDFSEEYSIHVRPGLGTNETQIKLDDGWNLTSLNVNVDSQFDNNLSALADVLNAVPKATGGYGETGGMPVPACNVPLGLYEGVVSCGPDGKKRLYGFRYVGFMPYAACPLELCGLEQRTCQGGPIYGLVFDEMARSMVFRPLHEVASIDPGPAATSPDELLRDEGDPDETIDDLPVPHADLRGRLMSTWKAHADHHPHR